MKKFIITISREFGCNAREVARKAAAELGVEFYDKDLVDMAAERAGISRDSFLDSEEMLDKNADRLLKSFGYGSSTQFYSDKRRWISSEILQTSVYPPYSSADVQTMFSENIQTT